MFWLTSSISKNPIVWYTGLCEEYVHLPRHAPGNRVNTKLHVNVAAPEQGCKLPHGRLGPRHGHAIPRHHEDFLCVCEELSSGRNACFNVLFLRLVALF